MHEKIKQFIETELHVEQDLTAGDELLLSGLVDSMGVMRLVRYVEEEFDLSVPPEDLTLENFATIDKIAAYLEGRQPS